jgi:hypothetical protein
LPKWIEQGEPGGVSCKQPQGIADDEVGIDPPAQADVKILGAIDIRNRNDDRLQLVSDCRCFEGLGVARTAVLLMSGSLDWMPL